MAVDNRPFKSKEQDGQGNEVIIRDQQLVEQGTTTTMPAGACFQTLDVDGRPVKIPRDNMMNIVLECIGIILNDSSRNLGTNVQKALGLQGNTVGHSTVSDFASVLGVGKYKGTFSGVEQNEDHDSWYAVNFQDYPNPYLKVFNVSGDGCKFAVDTAGNFYSKFDSSSEWKKIAKI